MPKFKKEALQDLLDGEESTLHVVSDRITGRSRWSVHHSLVFSETGTGKFFHVGYSEGATEQQDERPFEYDADDVQVEEVQPVERLVTVYEPV